MRMRPILPALLTTLPFALLPAQPEIPHIRVSGTARAEVAPDQMVWRLKVVSKNQALEAAATQHSQTVQQLLAFLKETGIPADQIQASGMAFGENWEWVNNSRVMQGYLASSQVQFRASDLERYGQLWIGLAKIPSISVEDVSYDYSRRIELQNETRRKALLAAREKAADMAETLGRSLGAPWAIEEECLDPFISRDIRSFRSNRNIEIPAEGAAQGEGLAPGKIAIRIQVFVTFMLLAGKE